MPEDVANKVEMCGAAEEYGKRTSDSGGGGLLVSSSVERFPKSDLLRVEVVCVGVRVRGDV